MQVIIFPQGCGALTVFPVGMVPAGHIVVLALSALAGQFFAWTADGAARTAIEAKSASRFRMVAASQ